MVQRQHGIHGFHATGTAEQVAGHGFGGIDHQLFGVLAEGKFQRGGFVGIAQWGRRAVRVHIINVARVEAGVFQGACHGQGGAFSIGRGNVVRIGAHAETGQFGVDFRAAFFGVFVFFQHQHARSFAHHEAVAVFIPRTGGSGGVVVAGGQRLHGGKTAHAEHTYRAFRAAGHHHVGIAVLNHAGGIADAVRAGGAGRYDAVAGALVAFKDGHVAGNQVDQRAGNKEGIDAARAVFVHHDAGFLNGRQAADAGTDVHTHAGFIQGGIVVQPGVGHGLQGSGNAVVDEGIHAARFFGANVIADLEIFHFAGNLGAQFARVKTGNPSDTAHAGQQVLPGIGHIVAHRGNLPQPGYHHSSLTHDCLSILRPARKRPQ